MLPVFKGPIFPCNFRFLWWTPWLLWFFFLNLHDVKAKDFPETVILALSKTKISHEKKNDKTKTSRQLEFVCSICISAIFLKRSLLSYHIGLSGSENQDPVDHNQLRSKGRPKNEAPYVTTGRMQNSTWMEFIAFNRNQLPT